jgi:hypothetical protein
MEARLTIHKYCVVLQDAADAETGRRKPCATHHSLTPPHQF